MGLPLAAAQGDGSFPAHAHQGQPDAEEGAAVATDARMAPGPNGAPPAALPAPGRMLQPQAPAVGSAALWAEVNPARTVPESNYADNRSADLNLANISSAAI